MLLQTIQSWLASLQLRAKAMIARTMVALIILYANWKGSAPKPDEIRSFKSHPKLKHRIFYPPPYVVGAKLPLFFDIHGGGFVVANPSIDDAVNARISRELNCIVVSCNYSKAPAAQYPVASNEITDTIIDVLSGGGLSFDESRVAIGGYSAGGNLTISVAQRERLRGRIAGAIAWYPATDLSDDTEPKALLRPYDFEGEIDETLTFTPLIQAAYIPPKQNLRDPQLSVVYTDRSLLPKHILIFGAENDFLCHEAWRMARRFVKQSDTVDWEKNQQTKYRFDEDNVRWRLIKHAKHGYTHYTGAKGEQEDKRVAQAEETFKEFKQFMLEGPFK